MDGRNCTGRKISLLNDSSEKAAVPTKPALTHSYSSFSAHSRSLSRTPSLSPQTPQLVRSSSSTDSRTPSPLTPPAYTTFGAPSHTTAQKSPHSQYFYQAQRYGKMDDPNASMYPPIPDASATLSSAYPLPQQLIPQQLAPLVPGQPQPQTLQRSSTSPSSEPSRVSTVSASSNSKPTPKKNQYPCPMAKQVGCTDYFTTSGHAARHAKKHTGKKDAFCPECNKAFTRKDNMEQHRRTHQNGRGASRASAADDSKVKKTTKQAVKKTIKPEAPQVEAALQQHIADQVSVAQVPEALPAAQTQLAPAVQPSLLDQSLLIPPTGPYYLGATADSGPVPALPLALSAELGGRPPLLRSSYIDNIGYMAPAAPMIDPESLHYSYPSPGLSNGLNSLALAASETQRLTEKPSSTSSAARSPASETPSDVTP